jgi:hypothetical protein
MHAVAIYVGIKTEVKPIKVIRTTRMTASSYWSMKEVTTEQHTVPQDGGRRFLRNAGTRGQDCAESWPQRSNAVPYTAQCLATQHEHQPRPLLCIIHLYMQTQLSPWSITTFYPIFVSSWPTEWRKAVLCSRSQNQARLSVGPSVSLSLSLSLFHMPPHILYLLSHYETCCPQIHRVQTATQIRTHVLQHFVQDERQSSRPFTCLLWIDNVITRR